MKTQRGSNRMHRATAILLAVGIGLFTAHAQAVLYGSVGGPNQSSNAGAILTIDPTTGAGTILGTPIAGEGITGLVVDNSGRLIGSTATITGDARLIEIDRATGALVNILAFLTLDGSPASVSDLAYNPLTGELFGNGPSTDDLMKIDMSTGVMTSVGAMGDHGGWAALGFDSAGTLYALGTYDSTLNTVDTADASNLTSVTLSGGPGALGLAANPSDGMIYYTDGDNPFGRTLYQVDPSTGVSTSIGPILADNNVHDLAFAPVPEPHEYALFAGLGLIGFAAWRRRRA
ncbi:MAG: hypothetical protein H7A46_05725 [Verrucomicrobiales bacterium]|nr:hypothetical protein [Verrucomicrobiales bacterium]